jgi:hypothetical protein
VEAKDLANVTDRELILGLGYEVKAGNAQVNARIDGHDDLLKKWSPTIESLAPIVRIGKWAIVFLGGILASVITGIIISAVKIGNVKETVVETNDAVVGTGERPGIQQAVEEVKAVADVAAVLSAEAKIAADEAAKNTETTRRVTEVTQRIVQQRLEQKSKPAEKAKPKPPRAQPERSEPVPEPERKKRWHDFLGGD